MVIHILVSSYCLQAKASFEMAKKTIQMYYRSIIGYRVSRAAVLPKVNFLVDSSGLCTCKKATVEV